MKKEDESLIKLSPLLLMIFKSNLNQFSYRFTSVLELVLVPILFNRFEKFIRKSNKDLLVFILINRHKINTFQKAL